MVKEKIKVRKFQLFFGDALWEIRRGSYFCFHRNYQEVEVCINHSYHCCVNGYGVME